jgi:NADPH:quinone reductase-like Zn-dependent oxidoreductase
MSQQQQQRYQFVASPTGAAPSLERSTAPVRSPGPHEVLVRVRANSLNRRDLMVLHGELPIPKGSKLVPLSDGAGEVVETGSGVTRFRKGDRVAASFFQGWIRGTAPPGYFGTALGGGIDGMLAEYVTLHEDGLVYLPAHLSYEEGATLPCAALTAWFALITRGHLQAGETVLLPGTGGVSIFGLQIAKAVGALGIVTSAHDDKLAKARALGAEKLINYRTRPDWDAAVREATNGSGADHVIDLGGKSTLEQSVASLANGGHLAIIGGFGGYDGQVAMMGLMSRVARVSGIAVGSRADFEAMNAFLEQHRITPVIDRSFTFDEAPAAYAYLESNRHFGKIVIRH